MDRSPSLVLSCLVRRAEARRVAVAAGLVRVPYRRGAQTAGAVAALALAGPAAAQQTVIPLGVSPNPVSSGGVVRVSLPEAGTVRVVVYDVLGREVAVLADGEQAAGEHAVALGAERLAPGVYVVRVTAGEATVVRRVTVAR